MNKIRELNDELAFKKDEIKMGPWAKTEIIAGYGYHPGKDRFHLSYLDEPIFGPLENTVPISGVQYLLESAFGVGGPIDIRTLYQRHGIGLPDEADVPSFLTPPLSDPEAKNLEATAIMRECMYQNGHFVQLFGVGITGTAENNITVHKVGYRETDIEMVVNTVDGQVDGMMIPFRFTESELDPNERKRYFGKKVDSNSGKTGFYLKRFDSYPQIKHIWRSSDEKGSKKTEVVANNDTVWDWSRDDALKSLVEIHLVVNEDDLKEWFNYKLDQPEAARFNTLALFTGRYSEVGKSDAEQFGDYTNVRLFSKLNIPTEHMSLEKDLEFIYRIYGS